MDLGGLDIGFDAYKEYLQEQGYLGKVPKTETVEEFQLTFYFGPDEYSAIVYICRSGTLSTSSRRLSGNTSGTTIMVESN